MNMPAAELQIQAGMLQPAVQHGHVLACRCPRWLTMNDQQPKRAPTALFGPAATSSSPPTAPPRHHSIHEVSTTPASDRASKPSMVSAAGRDDHAAIY